MVRVHTIDAGREQSDFLDKAAKFIHLFPIVLDDPAKQKRLQEEFPDKTEIESYYNTLKSDILLLKSPIVYCHNDLLLNNVIYDEDNDAASFIDYEYAAYNFQAYEIADHFCEFAGVDDVDFSLYPEKDLQLRWLRHYLTAWHRKKGMPPPEEPDVHKLYVAVNKCAPFSHFFWGIWAIVQAKHSLIDFDYLQYGIDKMKESRRLYEIVKKLE